MEQVVESTIPWGHLDQILELEPPEYANDFSVDYLYRTYYRSKHNDQPSEIKVKVTEIVRRRTVSQKVPKSVIERRRRMTKFGAAAECTPAENSSVTSQSLDDIFVTPTNKKSTIESSKKQEEDLSQNKQIICRFCQGNHWSSRCTILPPPKKEEDTKSNVYVPPKRRAPESIWTKVKISQLSEDADERDVVDLVLPFADPANIYLARDRRTGISKGFAFVAFEFPEDAQQVIEGLDGYGYQYQILKVELAKPSNRQRDRN